MEEGAEVFTDEFAVYNTLSDEGYKHDRVRHGNPEYVKYREDGEKVHTNTLEGFWSYLKGAAKVIHRGVSKHKLQGYLNEHTFRQSHRHDSEPIFFAMLSRLLAA